MPTEASNASSRRYDCPQCGAPVPFRSSIAIFAVCEHCRSMVVRRDFDVESFGTMAELPPDLSPLQPGTQGYWQGRAFTLTGRMRLHWKDGSWTEWCADFGSGTIGWIAEAMGFFMVSFAQTADDVLRMTSAPGAGSKMQIAGETWLVTDVKEARCMAAEGELPFPVTPQSRRLGIDLTGSRGQFATIELVEGGNRFYVGEYAQFDELHFTNLRKVPGWDRDADITRHRSQAVNCPQCAAPVNLRAEGLSMSAVCGSCGTILDSSTPALQGVGKVAQTTLKLKPVLPIGTRGVLRNQAWEVIGYMKRKDRWCFWEEFLLFSPWLGFRFLVTFQGHWTLVRILPGHHTENVWESEEFALFAREEASTTDVLGEFYWRVRSGEKAVLSDFVAPPRILSKEHSTELNEVTWSGGEYIDHIEVAQAFQVKLPPPSGPYLNQPNTHQQRWHEVRTPFIFALLAYVLMQLCCLGFGTKTSVLNTMLAYQAGAADATLITDRFTLKGGSAPVDVSSFTNSLGPGTYLALKGALVNARTQSTIPLVLPMTGFEGSAGWRYDAVLPAVPEGEYYFRFEPDASPGMTAASINLTASRGGLFWSNFILGLIGIGAWPAWLLLRSNAFERRRWMESDFNAYATSDDD